MFWMALKKVRNAVNERRVRQGLDGLFVCGLGQYTHITSCLKPLDDSILIPVTAIVSSRGI